MTRAKYLIIFVAIATLAVGYVAGQQSAAQRQAVSSQTAAGLFPADEPLQIRTSHDDPIVIDNFPIRVKLNRPAKEEDDTSGADPKYAWWREFTGFAHLILTVRMANGTITYGPEVVKLCEGCNVEIDMTPEGGGNKVPLIFDATVTAHKVTMRTGNQKFNYDAGTQLYSPAANYRITRIAIHNVDGDLVEFIDMFDSPNKRVELILTGRSH